MEERELQGHWVGAASSSEKSTSSFLFRYIAICGSESVSAFVHGAALLSSRNMGFAIVSLGYTALQSSPDKHLDNIIIDRPAISVCVALLLLNMVQLLYLDLTCIFREWKGMLLVRLFV